MNENNFFRISSFTKGEILVTLILKVVGVVVVVVVVIVEGVSSVVAIIMSQKRKIIRKLSIQSQSLFT
jgi:hypothetical protein